MYRRVLDATGFFSAGATRLVDPYDKQKQDSLTCALKSEAFLRTIRTSAEATGDSLRQTAHSLMLADLWGNQGDLALSPLDEQGTNTADRIQCHTTLKDKLLVNEADHAVQHLFDLGGDARIDFILDNSGIELLCDFVLADFLLTHRLAKEVVFHCKVMMHSLWGRVEGSISSMMLCYAES